MSDVAQLVFLPTPTQIGALTLDCSVTESHHGEVETTDHPVEQGADITDHVRPRPDSLTIEGIVSNTPIVQVGDSGQQFPLYASGRRDDAYSQLKSFKDNGTLLTIVTKLHTYLNMVLTSLEVPRSAQTADALHFTAGFKEIRIVQNQTVVLQTATPQGKASVNKGKLAATEITPPARTDSQLHQLTGFFGLNPR